MRYAAWLILLVFTAWSASAEAKTSPAPPKIECLGNARVAATPADPAYWFCLHHDDEGRLNVAVVDKDSLDYGHTRMTVAYALAILSNPDASALHPVILSEAGADLARLRSADLADLKRHDYKSDFSEASLVSLNPGAIGRLIDKAKALRQLGYGELARTSVEKVLASFEEKLKPGKPLSDEKQWRWMSLRLSYSSILRESGDFDRVIANYRALANDERIMAKYRTNAKVNLAATLAETGRYAEALATIDEAKAEFASYQDDGYHYNLAGSNRHFDWIRACALIGLDRKAEAEPLIAAVLASPENPVDEYADIYSTSSIERRLYACTGDVERMAAFVQRSPSHPLYGQFGYLYLQPGLNFRLERDNAFLKAVQARPELKDLAEQMVLLPPSAIPALNGWR